MAMMSQPSTIKMLQSRPVLAGVAVLVLLWSLVHFLTPPATSFHQMGNAGQCRDQVKHIVTELATDKYLPGNWESSRPRLFLANMTEQKAVQAKLNEYHISKKKKITEGNSENWELQQQVYLALANLDCVTTICETGFNGGHSATVWLSGKSINRLFSFDLGAHGYVFTALQFFGMQLPGRITATIGDSTITLPQMQQTLKQACDILVVDGGHTVEIAIADIANFRPMANPRFNIFIIDDTNCEAPHCEGPVKALAQAVKIGWVEVLGKFSNLQGDRGFTVGRYKL